jgi:ribosome-associated heat shock protein Hsp15
MANEGKHDTKHEAGEALPNAVRLDKWLYAARFFKTRQLAVGTITAGHVDVNGERAKPAKVVRVGDEVMVRKPPYSTELIVRGIGEKRVAAPLARELYDEKPESIAARQILQAELRDLPPPLFKGRPTKQDRRALQRLHQSMTHTFSDED